MSSMSSMPIEIRIISGPIPAARSSSSLSCWWVVEPGWMISDLASPTLATWEKSWTASMQPLASLAPALDAEGEDRARSLRQVLVRQLVVAVGRQAGVVHVLDSGVLLEELGHLLGVCHVAVHPNVERLQALEEEEGREGLHRRPVVAEHLGPRLHQPAEVAEVLEEAEVVVALGRFGHARELAVVPGKLARRRRSRPPIVVPWPQMNLVAEWTTMSAPQSSGRQR